MEFKPGVREEATPASQRVPRDREEQKELRERAAPGRERGPRGVAAQQRQQRLAGQRGVEQESSERRRCSSSWIRREETADLLHERLTGEKADSIDLQASVVIVSQPKKLSGFFLEKRGSRGSVRDDELGSNSHTGFDSIGKLEKDV